MVPSTKLTADEQPLVVFDKSKFACAPVFNAVPVKVHVRGELASAVPPVRVNTIVPVATASLNV